MPDARTDEALGAAVLGYLDALGEPYEVMEVDPALADTAAFCEHYGIAPEESANCIVVASKKEPKQYCACLVLATTRLDVNKTVKRLLGASKASFASPDETIALTGMMIGGVTPFALPEGLPLYVDARVIAADRVWVGGGSRSQKVAVAPRVFERLPGTQVVEGLALELS
jgi:prolyl-tRNA editing enzyme YbaK/EbsC (Cys-tRNA(Pro) deacylase)